MDTNYSLADIAAATGGSRNNSDDGWGGDGWWIILLFICLCWGGFGGFGGWGGNNGGGSATQGYDTRADLQRGFDNQAVIGKLDALTNGLCQQGYQNQQGFHGVDNAVCQLGYQIQGGMNGINTTMLQGFNAQNVALMQGQNALATQLADCCCQEQRAIDGVNYNLSTQSCAIQNGMNMNTRDILENQNNNTRQILDYLCQDKISTLQSENQSLKFAASQQAQNNYLSATLDANTAEILRRTAPIPVPSYNVPAPYPFIPPVAAAV